jgi:hypothetical protein
MRKEWINPEIALLVFLFSHFSWLFFNLQGLLQKHHMAANPAHVPVV